MADSSPTATPERWEEARRLADALRSLCLDKNTVPFEVYRPVNEAHGCIWGGLWPAAEKHLLAARSEAERAGLTWTRSPGTPGTSHAGSVDRTPLGHAIHAALSAIRSLIAGASPQGGGDERATPRPPSPLLVTIPNPMAQCIHWTAEDFGRNAERVAESIARYEAAEATESPASPGGDERVEGEPPTTLDERIAAGKVPSSSRFCLVCEAMWRVPLATPPTRADQSVCFCCWQKAKGPAAATPTKGEPPATGPLLCAHGVEKYRAISRDAPHCTCCGNALRSLEAGPCPACSAGVPLEGEPPADLTERDAQIIEETDDSYIGISRRILAVSRILTAHGLRHMGTEAGDAIVFGVDEACALARALRDARAEIARLTAGRPLVNACQTNPQTPEDRAAIEQIVSVVHGQMKRKP